MIHIRAKKAAKYFLAGAPFLIFVVVSALFYMYATPEEVIGWIGVNNAYLLMGVLGFLSGVMTFSGMPYHLVLVALSAGGLNFFLLALSITVGLALGDSTSYLLGYHGATIVPERLKKILARIRILGERYPRIAPLIFFLYGAFVPFSNDFIGITMGLARYPFWRVMTPLMLGTLALNTAVAYFGINIYDFLTSI